VAVENFNRAKLCQIALFLGRYLRGPVVVGAHNPKEQRIALPQMTQNWQGFERWANSYNDVGPGVWIELVH
jgi:hypothetical protein